jgi:hypothetical protein
MPTTKEFVAQLMTFDKKGEGDEVIDENVLLEVTELTNDGRIEIAFNDRNERCYLKFSLPTLLQHACLVVGNKAAD